MNLNNFFNPSSVAIIGASADPKLVGHSLMKNLMAGGARTLYPITLQDKEVLGVPAFTSIHDVPGTIDLAIIAVRADIVGHMLEECGKKGISTAIIISAGFKEVGPEGKAMEEHVAAVAKQFNIALLGPNCLGTINTTTDFNASFTALKPKKGRLAFLSQSGALGTAMLDWSIGEGVGFSKFISLGNEAQLTEIEFLEYLRDDPDTDAILLYLEKVSDGAAFMRLAAAITPVKPIVVLKAGTSGRGAAAIMSHTGSLAPESSVFTAACKQEGIITVNSVREFFNVSKLLSIQSPNDKRISNLAVVTNGGGPSVVATDLIETSKSLSLADFNEPTKAALRSALPPMAAVGNPVDVIGDAPAQRYQSALDIISNLLDVDGIMAIVTPQMMTQIPETAVVLSSYRGKKPIFPVFIGGPTMEPVREILIQHGLVNFNSPLDLVEALDALVPRKTAPGTHDTHATGTHTTLKQMPFLETQRLLDTYGIQIAGVFAETKGDVAAAFVSCGSTPCVMKAFSPDAVHKTDVGAVEVGIPDAIAATESWDRIEARIKSHVPEAKIEGMLIQPTTTGKEIIIGMKRDATFGPTILVGIGGIFAETLKDTALRIAPVPEESALAMLNELKGSSLLHGLRGEVSVDFSALARIISALGKLALEHPEIKEIDLNPVFATPSGTTVVDARIMI